MTSVAMMWKGCALKTEYNFMGRFAAKVVDVARHVPPCILCEVEATFRSSKHPSTDVSPSFTLVAK